jgi:hypothetical protein
LTLRVSRDQVLRYRTRASHLEERLPTGSLTQAAYGGLQDSIPRAGVIGLYARVHDVAPDSWEDPSLAQIWFRGGADYIVPRRDLGIFTLGCLPRDEGMQKLLNEIADDAHRVLDGRVLKVREVVDALRLENNMSIKGAAVTGRLLIRWNASMIWLIGCDAPKVDPEDARRELARRFLHWFGPQPKDRFRWWTGVRPSDATQTWSAIRPEVVEVEIADSKRMMLEADVDALVGAEPIEGLRLIHNDDPYLKLDRDLVVADKEYREWVFPPIGTSPGYSPGAIVLDGEIAGVWQRQQRRVTIHPWRKLPTEDVEREAFRFPIAARSKAEVRWEAVG